MRAAAKVAGALLIVVAIAVWWTFDYDHPGLFGIWQVLNWVIVCVIASAGCWLFTLGRPQKPPS